MNKSKHNRENKKEVIQLQVPLQLPCDDLPLLTEFRFDLVKKLVLTQTLLGWDDGRCVQGTGTYSPDRDEIRLLGILASRGRVTVLDLN